MRLSEHRPAVHCIPQKAKYAEIILEPTLDLLDGQHDAILGKLLRLVFKDGLPVVVVGRIGEGTGD